MSLNRYGTGKDRNHKDIVDALLAAGASVQVLSAEGVPDLLVGYAGHNFLLEVKAPAEVVWRKSRSKKNLGELIRETRPAGKLNDAQREWHDAWKGQKCVVHSVAEALRALGLGAQDRPAEAAQDPSDAELLGMAHKLRGYPDFWIIGTEPHHVWAKAAEPQGKEVRVHVNELRAMRAVMGASGPVHAIRRALGLPP